MYCQQTVTYDFIQARLACRYIQFNRYDPYRLRSWYLYTVIDASYQTVNGMYNIRREFFNNDDRYVPPLRSHVYENNIPPEEC